MANTPESPGIADDAKEWERFKKKWHRNTEPERDIFKGLRSSDNKDLSRILYKAYWNEQRRMQQLIQHQLQQETIDQTQQPSQKRKRSTPRSRDFITAWPIPQENFRAKRRRILREKSVQQSLQHNIRRVTKGRASIDMSGTRLYAPFDGIVTDSSSDDDDSLSGPSNSRVVRKANCYVYTSEVESNRLPSVQINQCLATYLTKLSKEKLRQRLDTLHAHTIDFDISADDELIATQLLPLTRKLTDRLDTLLLGMADEALDRKKKRRAFNDWETVIRVASQQGWANDVIHRSLTRCRMMFGRDSSQLKGVPSLHYLIPRTEPQPHSQNADETRARPGQPSNEFSFATSRQCCPVETCVRNRIPFAHLSNLKAHVESVHSLKLHQKPRSVGTRLGS